MPIENCTDSAEWDYISSTPYRTDMNNSSSVKLPGQDEVLDKLAAIKCERKEG